MSTYDHMLSFVYISYNHHILVHLDLVDLPSNPESTHSPPISHLRCLALYIAVHRVLFLPLLIFFVGCYCSIEIVVGLLQV